MKSLKNNTTHVILRDEPASARGTYIIWSQHKSENAALKLCRTLGKNGAIGHTIVVPITKLADYRLSECR